MKEHLKHLIQRVDQIAADESPRRRMELVERAHAAGRSMEDAYLIYDISEDEGLDPALAFELVLSGIGVRSLSPPTEDNWLETQVEAPPEWVSESPTAPTVAAHERQLRTTFRRVRGLIEQHDSVHAAIEAFLSSPDVAETTY